MHFVNGGTGMTLQDYELLITTMEEIASLDRGIKNLENKITRANSQIVKDEGKTRTCSIKLDSWKQIEEPNTDKPELNEFDLQEMNENIARCKSQIKEHKNRLKDYDKDIKALEYTYPKWISPDFDMSWKKPTYTWLGTIILSMLILGGLSVYSPSTLESLPKVADKCSPEDLEAYQIDYIECDTWHNAMDFWGITVFGLGFVLFFFAIARRYSIMATYKDEKEIIDANVYSRKQSIRSDKERINHEKESIMLLNSDYERSKQLWIKEQKEYDSGLMKIQQLEDEIKALGKSIDSKRLKVIEHQSEIEKSKQNILKALESVAYLTPHSSKL